MRGRWLELGGGDPGGGLDAVDVGHADVHQDDVRPQLAGRGQGGGTVARLADNLELGLGAEEEPQPGAHQLLVVDQQHPDRHAGSWIGSRATTRKPPPGAGPASRSPPSRATRSRIPISPWPVPGSAGVAPSSFTVTSRSAPW